MGWLTLSFPQKNFKKILLKTHTFRKKNGTISTVKYVILNYGNSST
jgi:hypothetical protein